MEDTRGELRREGKTFKRSISMMAAAKNPKVLIFLPSLLLYIIGAVLPIAYVPNIMTNYFASTEAGEAIACESYHHEAQPPACQDAHGKVLMWTGWSSFVNNSVFGIFMAPLVGLYSDIHGRRPFLSTGLLLQMLPSIVLIAHLKMGLPLWWYYPASAITGGIPVLAVSAAYMADVLPPAERAAGFGFTYATFAAGIAFGPALGAALGKALAIYGAGALKMAAVAYMAFVVPESTTAGKRALARAASAELPAGPLKGLSSMRIIFRNSVFVRLAVCMMITSMVSNGLQDSLLQYLQLRFGFGARDNAKLFMLIGVFGTLVQLFLLQPMFAVAGEKGALLLGFSVSALCDASLALCTAKWQVFVIESFAALSLLSVPAITTVKSIMVADHEQGSVQGALAGLTAAAQGVGPLLFAHIFRATTSSKASEELYFPGAYLLTGAAMLLGAVFIVMSVRSSDIKPHVEPAHAAECGRSGERPMTPISSDDEPLLAGGSLSEGESVRGGRGGALAFTLDAESA